MLTNKLLVNKIPVTLHLGQQQEQERRGKDLAKRQAPQQAVAVAVASAPPKHLGLAND